MKSIARRIVDRNVLHLIKMWLKTPVEVRDQNGKRRVEGGKGSRCGVPQGGIVSPMLANLYMNRFLKYWRVSGQGERLQAHVVAYADDLVILCRHQADEAMSWMRSAMTRLGLSVNEAKTTLKDAAQERFEFLGYSFRPASSAAERQPLPGGQPLEEKPATGQGQGGRPARPRQYGAVARGPRPAQQPAARLVRLLQLRVAHVGVPGAQSAC